jgi:hypothetical protein
MPDQIQRLLKHLKENYGVYIEGEPELEDPFDSTQITQKLSELLEELKISVPGDFSGRFQILFNYDEGGLLSCEFNLQEKQ